LVERELREALEDALADARPPLADLILDAQALMLTPGHYAALPDTSDSRFNLSDHQDEGQRSE
jgi:hypothetical protein